MRSLSKWALLILSVYVTLAATARVTSAKCMAGSVDVWPPSETAVATTPLILIEGSRGEDELVADIASQKPRLESSAGTVALKVVEIYKSREGLAAALLKPTQKLQPGLEYALTYDKNLKYNKVYIDLDMGMTSSGYRGSVSHEETHREAWLRAQRERRARENSPASEAAEDPEDPDAPKPKVLAKYTVSEVIDRKAPRWQKISKFLSSKHTRLGCGPASFVEVETLIEEDSEDVFYLARAVRVDNKKDIQIYPIRAKADRTSVRVGHGMCGGEFSFKPGKRYRVTLQPVDFAGNRGRVSKAVEVVGPTPQKRKSRGEQVTK